MKKQDHDEALISADTVAAMIDMSKRTVWRMMKKPGAPAPVYLSYKATRWNKSEVEQWIKTIRKGKSDG